MPTTFSVLPLNQSYRPMLQATFAIDYWLGGGYRPAVFQIQTFAWFALLLISTAALLMTITRNEWLTLAATAIYGLHPVCAETVNYIVQRGDLLSTLGVVSALFEASFPGIAIQAVGLTAGTLFALLLAYRSGLIAATENFKLGVTAATGAIMLVYLVSWVLRMFGVSMPFLHDNGIVGIGISIVIVVVAALNLVLDFDFIEQGEEKKAPKYMEWYAAFGLLVTLVWLYLEMLRLLAKLRSND